MPLPSVFVTTILFATAYAAIGPNANLYIVNKNIAPDGFTRSCVCFFIDGTSTEISSTAPY
jgi:iron transport multicopper oxidase